jgi:hypothetical protein
MTLQLLWYSVLKQLSTGWQDACSKVKQKKLRVSDSKETALK